MLWPLYLTSGLAVGLFIYGCFQLRFERLEDQFRPRFEGGTALYRLCRPLVQILAAYNQKLDVEKISERYKTKLLISGNPLHLIAVELLAIKELCVLGGVLFGIFLVMTTQATPLMPIILGVGAFFLPDLKLNSIIAKRKRAIFKALPFCMDLLTLAVEAGFSFTQAIAKVAEKGPENPIRDELDKMLQDLRLGLSRREALIGLAERTDMYEIRAFTSALIQADKLGSPIGEALRTQSDIRRIERFQKAEKAANEAPVKMLFPLLFFIFPAVFIVLLVPIMLKFMSEGM